MVMAMARVIHVSEAVMTVVVHDVDGMCSDSHGGA